MTNKRNLSKIFAVLILFLVKTVAFALGTAEGETNNSNPAFSFNNVQFYRPFSGNIYPGDGKVEQVEGIMCDNYVIDFSSNRLSIGNIGFVSVDGKLTLSLPAFVEDNKLIAMDKSRPDERVGILHISGISFSFNRGERGQNIFVYANGNFTWDGYSLRRGWNLIDSWRDTVINTTNVSANDFVWFYEYWKPDIGR